MTTQYTPILKLALPVTGELSGTWGDVVNNNITSMVEQAVAGAATISTWAANSHTLTTANGTTAESRCAALIATSTTAASELICPAATKLYVLINNSSFAVTLKTASGTGVSVPAGKASVLWCDGTNVVSQISYLSTLSLGTDLAIADGGTGASDAATARVNLLPAYTGNANKILAVNGGATDVTWVTAATGSVTSVAVSGGTTGLTTSGGPVTGAGTITIAGTLALTNGGTGATDAATARTNLGLGTIAIQNASNVAITGGSITGTSVSGTTGAFSGILSANAALRETRTAMAADNIDLSTGNFFSKTVAAITTFTVSNVPATGTAASFILDLTNGGAFTVTWWSGVKWPYGTAPTLTVSGRDVLGFFTYDGGTTWTGLLLGKDVK